MLRIRWERVMSFNWSRVWVGAAVFVIGSVPSVVVAQPGAFGGGFGPPLAVVAPPRTVAPSDDHYKFLHLREKT